VGTFFDNSAIGIFSDEEIKKNPAEGGAFGGAWNEGI